MRISRMTVVAAMTVLSALPAVAQDRLGGYAAWIGAEDLYNSNGQRLTEPWQIIRQDRANFHRYGISQQGDEWDPFFDDAENRARMERMIMDGHIDPAAARAILQGDVSVYVTIFGHGSRNWIEVAVYR